MKIKQLFEIAAVIGVAFLLAQPHLVKGQNTGQPDVQFVRVVAMNGPDDVSWAGGDTKIILTNRGEGAIYVPNGCVTLSR